MECFPCFACNFAHLKSQNFHKQFIKEEKKVRKSIEIWMFDKNESIYFRNFVFQNKKYSSQL